MNEPDRQAEDFHSWEMLRLNQGMDSGGEIEERIGEAA